MTVIFMSVSHTLGNLSVQAREFRGELLDVHFEVFAFANEAIELSRHAHCSLCMVIRGICGRNQAEAYKGPTGQSTRQGDYQGSWYLPTFPTQDRSGATVLSRSFLWYQCP